MQPFMNDPSDPKPEPLTERPTQRLEDPEPTPAQQSAATPAWQPTPVVTTTQPHRRGWYRFGAAMLALGLIGGTVGGGAAGTLVASRWHTPAAAATSASSAPIAPQTVSDARAKAASVAGAVYSKVGPSVVEILVSGSTVGGMESSGAGSGFVVDAHGLILTNNHVVEGAKDVTVHFSDGQDRTATVLGTDASNDLALVKVDLPANVPVIALGDSEKVAIGDAAIAIGSPFGLDETVTQGIISSVHRDYSPGNGRTQRNLIQTDAAINPGNSGGPLLNDQGEVIGINAMIESPVRGSVGVGFAIPINTAKSMLSQLEAGKHVEPVWLGISGRELNATVAKQLGISVDKGVMVAAVVPNGPADEAGLKGATNQDPQNPTGGDIVTAVDGKAVTTVAELSAQLSTHTPGDKVDVTILRDGKQQKVTVTLQVWPSDPTS